ERVEQLCMHARELGEDSEAKQDELRRLSESLGGFDQHSAGHHKELLRMKRALEDMEERSTRASEGLSEASAQLDLARGQLDDLRHTQDFLRQVFESLAEVHDPRQFPGHVVHWLTEHFGVDR